MEGFSIECRKTKTKANTLANHVGKRQYSEYIKTQVITCCQCKALEWVTFGFGCPSDWQKKWHGLFEPII